MTWTYSGNPANSVLDKYRYEIGDTIEDEPLLQDEEIQYVIDNNDNHDKILAELYRKLYVLFSRDIKRSIGPLSEDPGKRAEYYKELAEKYEKRSVTATVPYSGTYDLVGPFSKGMHDNV